MVSVNGANSGFENKFREFLQEPETQDAIRKDQAKEIAVMRKMEEMEKLEELQGQREQLAVALQDLPPEAQRVVYPILRLKMVQNLLFATLKETRKAGTSFVHAVRDPALMGMLERMRDELRNDPENAKRIEMEWFHNVGMCAEDKVKKAPKKERGVLPATQMLPIIQSGAQLRVNGNHKFRQGKYKEALEMYMQGCVGFELYQATNAQDQKLLDEARPPPPSPPPLREVPPAPRRRAAPCRRCTSPCARMSPPPPSRRATGPSVCSRATRCSASAPRTQSRSTAARSPTGDWGRSTSRAATSRRSSRHA